MLPILFRTGPVAIYSFGVMLFLMAVVATFLVWRSARRQGFAEEKILDVLFLSVIVAIIAGRIGYVSNHWAFFSPDWSRILFIYKYPGFSYLATAVFGGVATVAFSLGLKLSVLSVADIFSLAILPSMSLGFLGCFLDGCYANQSVIVGLLLASFGAGVLANLLAKKISHTAELLEVSRRHGFYFLGHLIFLLASFLILGEVSDSWVVIGTYLLIATTGGFLVWRFWQLFRYPVERIYGAISQRRS